MSTVFGCYCVGLFRIGLFVVFLFVKSSEQISLEKHYINDHYYYYSSEGGKVGIVQQSQV